MRPDFTLDVLADLLSDAGFKVEQHIGLGRWLEVTADNGVFTVQAHKAEREPAGAKLDKVLRTRQ